VASAVEEWPLGDSQPNAALRDAILRQDEEYRQADAKWELNHGPIPGGARVLVFSAEAFTERRGSRTDDDKTQNA
jgi:hypothetical protein